jgi:hypothetical protein
MSQDCQSAFCNNVFMTSTNKSKGKGEIEFNMVFPICEFRSSLVQITFKPKYSIQKCFVQVLNIWAKGIRI